MTTPSQPDAATPQHTPGPWIVGEPVNRSVAIRGRGPIISGCIATVDLGWPHEDQQAEQLANAQAIASVPELSADLAACRKTLCFFASVIKSGESWSSECQKALDAALATGKETA